MLYKRLVLYFQKYKYYLPYYTYDELVYPGVKVEGLEIDHLVTYFDYYDVDLTNAVYMNQAEYEHNTFEVHARQLRLNHKPFTYKINVVSDKQTQAVVRVFIGPKYDEYGRYIHIDENRINFVEFDKFKYELNAGKNVILRDSHNIYYATDRTSYKQLYQWAMSGTQGDFATHGSELYYAFPNRFLLPKGKHGGQVYQFYAIVSPYKAPSQWAHQQEHYQHYHHDEQYLQHQQVYQKLHGHYEYEYVKYPMVGLGVQYLDDYPLGYPFDRPIDEYSFYVPNGYFQDVVIYHKGTEGVAASAYHDDLYSHGNVYGHDDVYSHGKVYEHDDAYSHGNGYGYGDVYSHGNVYNSGNVYNHGNGYGLNNKYSNGYIDGHDNIYNKYYQNSKKHIF